MTGWLRSQKLGCFAVAVAAGMLGITQGLQAQTGTPQASENTYVLSGAIAPPAGEKFTSFDIGYVDPVLNRYFFASRTTKSVIGVDTTTNQIVSEFKPGFAGIVGSNNTAGPDGVLVVDNKEVWVGDAPSTLWALDVNSGNVIAKLVLASSPNRTDELCYDPVDHIVAAANNADNPPFVTFVSTTSHTILGQVKLDGTNGTPNATNGAEQCQWNPRDGLIYLTIPEISGPGDNSASGGVVVFNPVTRAVVRILGNSPAFLAACSGPQGLAIGPMRQGLGELGLGCTFNPTASTTAIIDEATGNVIRAFPNDGGNDMIWYNPGDNKYYLGGSNAGTPPGSNPSLFIIDASNFAVQAPFTGFKSSAHSVAVDPVFNQAYVPVSSASTSGLCSQFGAVDANGCILIYKPATAPATIFAAVAPNSRTTSPNRAVTAFASIINASGGNATACSISLDPGVMATFRYQTTNASNTPTGIQNTPANIAPGATQTFFVEVNPSNIISEDLRLIFGCSNSNPTPFYNGLNRLLLTSTGGAVPDLISTAATQSNDGNLVFPTGGPTTQAFATASMNISAAGTVTFTPSDTPFSSLTGPLRLPLSYTICQTNSSGQCQGSPAPSVTLTVATNQTVTFSVFVTNTSQKIPYVPAINRIFVRATQGETAVGEASVAVKEQ